MNAIDLFAGAGGFSTGALMAGCELNPAYKPLQDERLAQQGLILESA